MPMRQWRVKFRDGTYELVIADGRSAAIREARDLRKKRRGALSNPHEDPKVPEVASVKQVGAD